MLTVGQLYDAWWHVSRKKNRTSQQQAVVSLRKSLGLTQRELAAALKVTVTTVCRWETSRPPSGAHLRELARFAHDAGEIEICNILMQPFAPEESPELLRELRGTPTPLPVEDACSELRLYCKDYPLIADQYLKLLEHLKDVHVALVIEAIAALGRSPSTEQANKVLQFQRTHERLQEEVKHAKET
jgi:transcriptional regulator with XRE-family HTH domain